MRKKAYRATDVKRVDVAAVLAAHPRGECCEAGVDVSKEEVQVSLRFGAREFERPWRVKQPQEVPVLVERLRQIRARFFGEGSIVCPQLTRQRHQR